MNKFDDFDLDLQNTKSTYTTNGVTTSLKCIKSAIKVTKVASVVYSEMATYTKPYTQCLQVNTECGCPPVDHGSINNCVNGI